MSLPSYNLLSTGTENTVLIAPAASERLPIVGGLCLRTTQVLRHQFPDLAPQPILSPAAVALTHYDSSQEALDQEVRAATDAAAANAVQSAVIKGVINAA